jgi:hypothetical protein
MTQGARVLSWIGAAAVAGIGIFGFLAWHSVRVEQAPPNVALLRFAEIRERLALTEPVLQIDEAGGVTRRNVPVEARRCPQRNCAFSPTARRSNALYMQTYRSGFSR